EKLPVEKVWGIGSQTTAFLYKCGVRTALHFAQKSKEWVQERFTKPHYEIWQELRGLVVHELVTEPKTDYKSISKTKTFTPPSNEKDFVYSQLSKNVENACIKARRYKLATKRIFFFLKSQDFRFYGFELKLSRPSVAPTVILNALKEYFEKVFNYKILYRATGVILTHLTEDANTQLDLFGQSLKAEKLNEIFGRTDELARRYGKHTLFLGSSLLAMNNRQHEKDRGILAERKTSLFVGETSRKRLGIPMLGAVV
ncbi:DNA polymerase IV, partial [Patescibacteria group bacterium]|nr:DNA polymerase IV [Patescibacteria group bacterium]